MPAKKMTYREQADEWQSIAEQERAARIIAEEYAETYRQDLRAAERELYRPSFWQRLKDRITG